MRLSACPHLSSPPFGFVGVQHHLPSHDHAKCRNRSRHSNSSSSSKRKSVSWGGATILDHVNDDVNIVNDDVNIVNDDENVMLSCDGSLESESSDTSTMPRDSVSHPKEETTRTRSTTSRRKVRFCPAADNQRYENPFQWEELDPSQLWYNEQDCAALKLTLIEDAVRCTDPVALAWLRGLTQTYRDLQDVFTSHAPMFLRTLLGKAPPTETPVQAWFLGMEQWILAKPLYRESRRARILKRIQYIQQVQQQAVAQQGRRHHVSRAQHEIYKASEEESRVAAKWAAYIGKRVAQSVQQDNEQELQV